MRRALYVAPFGELAEPAAVADLAAEAEASGFDGLFVWDHLWRPPERSPEVGDAWISLAAAACATHAIRLGPMVVPLARRRPQKVARESVALDRLARGRLVLGVGLGVDTGGELERFGEEVDARVRGDVLDEALEVLLALWSGEPVEHRGERFAARSVTFLPRPLQSPRIPVWGAARGGSGPRPLARAARLDGLFPVGASIAQLEAMIATVRERRGSLEGFDVSAQAHVASERRLAAAGATWVVHTLEEGVSMRAAVAVARAGPGATARPR